MVWVTAALGHRGGDTVDLDEDFIDEEGVTVAPMLSFQLARIDRAKLDAPETDGFAGYSDASLSEKIFYISVAVTTRLRLNR